MPAKSREAVLEALPDMVEAAKALVAAARAVYPGATPMAIQSACECTVILVNDPAAKLPRLRPGL
jgi:hypothetical protein